ncbi:MAG: hypothetical protein H6704_09805 [Myxococcales bacterium]|nr:hypothetical protein [Myxococcales bacterium]
MPGMGGVGGAGGAPGMGGAPACVPQCLERACGDDGCEGSCGDCPAGLACSDEGACLGPANELSITDENRLTWDPEAIEVARAYLEVQQGYLAVHIDDDGQPGELLGAQRVGPRMVARTRVELGRRLAATQRLHVILHLDEPRNSRYDPEDPIALSATGEPLVLIYDLAFQSTTTAVDSPYYAYPCPLEQWREDPTDLVADCRCGPNVVALDICKSSTHASQDERFGAGPRIDALPQDHIIRGGFVDAMANEIVFGVRWQDQNHVDPGVIMAVDYVTGDRRIVSGRWVDPNEGYVVYGEGPELHEPYHTLRGPDGNIYSYTWRDDTTDIDGVQIVRIEPATGDRTLVWGSRNPAHGQCTNGAEPPGTQDVQYWKYGFAMDPEGNYYLPTIANGRPAAGRGILRISADGSACTWVTMDGAAPGNLYEAGIGQGYPVDQFNYEGMGWHDGFLYATNNADLIRIDPATGDRRRVAGVGVADASGAVVGRFLEWNPHWDILMFSGKLGPPDVVGGVDLATGTVYQFAQCLNIAENNPFATDCYEGAASTAGLSERPTFVLPDGNWVSAHGNGFALVEPRTGNSVMLSY